MAASSAVAGHGDGCIGFHVTTPVWMGASCGQLTETLAVVDRNLPNEEGRRFSFSPWFDRIASNIPAAPMPMHMVTTCWRSLKFDHAFRFALIIEQLGGSDAVRLWIRASQSKWAEWSIERE